MQPAEQAFIVMCCYLCLHMQWGCRALWFMVLEPFGLQPAANKQPLLNVGAGLAA